jgi:hypothetical protein
MKLLREAVVALLATAMLACGSAMASSTTNYSDQWWIPAEDGWGASVLQQHDVLFIDLFVYDASSSPTWFTAAVFLQPGSPAGHTVFTGDLYRTTGPYFGGAFDPAAVRRTRVGTLTFDANSATTAVMTYSIDGTPVVKNVTRQLWRYENIGGIYVGGMTSDEVCGNQVSDRVSDHVRMDVVHRTDNVVTIGLEVTSDDSAVTCTITGTYGQSGHLGQILNGTMQCAGGALTGTMNIFEIERSVAGLMARFNATAQTPNGPCTLTNGSIGGVRR